MGRTWKKRWAILLLVVAVIAVLVAGVTPILISSRYENAIKERIPIWVAKATDSLYTVAIDDISISTFTKNITATGITLRLDSNRLRQLRETSQLPPNIFAMSVDRIELNKIHWADLLADKEFSSENVSIIHPVLKIYQTNPREQTNDRKKKIPKLEGVDAGHIKISDPEVFLQRFDDSISFFWKGGQIELNEWEFETGDKASRFFYAKSGNVKLDSAVINKPGSFYAFKAGVVSFSSTKNSLYVRNFSVRPALSKEEYYRRIGYQDELFTIICPQIEFLGFDWESLSRGVVHANKIIATSPYANVYMSRIPPPAPRKRRKFPTQQIREMKTSLLIDTFEIRNGDLSYTERNDNSKQEGTVPFKKFNAVFTNITNIPGRLNRNPYCNASFNTNLFGTTLYSTFRFNLADSLGAFEAEGRQMGIEGTNVNPLTRPVALMEVKSLNLHKVDFHLLSDGRVAKGNFLFLYDDLKLKVLKPNEDGSLGSMGFVSFIVNKALIYPANPMPGEDPRRISSTTKRDPYKSFFNFLWSSIRTGTLLTAGRNPQVVDVIMNRSKAKDDKRLAEGK